LHLGTKGEEKEFALSHEEKRGRLGEVGSQEGSYGLKGDSIGYHGIPGEGRGKRGATSL